MSFAKDHRPKIPSAGPLDSLIVEIKRCVGAIGIFSNEEVIARLVGIRTAAACMSTY